MRRFSNDDTFHSAFGGREGGGVYADLPWRCVRETEDWREGFGVERREGGRESE